MAERPNAVAMTLLRQDASAVDRQGGREGRGGAFYTADVVLGTPAKTYSLLVDTGSTATFASCKWCKHCGGTNKMDPRESKTAKWIRCKQADGLDLAEKEWDTIRARTSFEEEPGPAGESKEYSRIVKEGFNLSSCKHSINHASCDGEFCKYRIEYLDQSATGGRVLQDILHLANGATAQLDIGCAEYENRKIAVIKRMDGLIGLAPIRGSPPQQLHSAGVFTSPSFGLCYGRVQEKKGILVMGSWNMKKVKKHFSGQLKYASMTKRSDPATQRFVLGPRAMWLGSMKIADQNLLSQGIYKGIMLDSGSAFTRMVPSLLLAFQQSILDHVSKVAGLHPLKDHPKLFQEVQATWESICFRADHSIPFEEVFQSFPVLKVEMQGGWSLHLDPSRYMFYLAEEEVTQGTLSRDLQEWGYARSAVFNVSQKSRSEKNDTNIVHEGAWCTGIRVHHNTGSTIGGPALSGMFVHYDPSSSRVGFVDADCQSLQRDILQTPDEASTGHGSFDIVPGDHQGVDPSVRLPQIGQQMHVWTGLLLILLLLSIALGGVLAPWIAQALRRRVRYTALGRSIEIPSLSSSVSIPRQPAP